MESPSFRGQCTQLSAKTVVRSLLECILYMYIYKIIISLNVGADRYITLKPLIMLLQWVLSKGGIYKTLSEQTFLEVDVLEERKKAGSG